MLVQVTEKPREDLALLVKEEILKSSLLLFVKHLFHNLREVTAKDRQRLFILVEEAAEHVKKREILLLSRLINGRRSSRVFSLLFLNLHLVIVGTCSFVSILDALLEGDFSQGLLFVIFSSRALVIAIDFEIIVEGINELLLRGILSLQKFNKNSWLKSV